MKKLVLNISETTYERLRFESIMEKKSIADIITERIFHKPFHADVEESYEKWVNSELDKIIKE